MTTVSKFLVIFSTVASLVFFIFIAVGTFAGQNYADQMRDKDLSTKYVFKTETTEGGESYSVETRRAFSPTKIRGAVPVFQKEQVINNTPILPKAVLETRKHLKKLQTSELSEIKRKIAELNGKSTQTKTAKDADLVALESRLKILSDVLDTKNNEFIKLSEEAERIVLESVKTNQESNNRRQEGSQVEQQLEEILTDHYRIVEQIGELEVLLVRLQGTVARLEKRRQQLLARGAKIENPITAGTKAKSKSVVKK